MAAVVSNPTNIAVTGPGGWDGTTNTESNCDTTNGNKFTNAAGTLLLARNTTVSAIILDFYADLNGVEVLIGSKSIPGSGTNNGGAILGPFPAKFFNDHTVSITGTSAQGAVVFKQRSGSAGDIKVAPQLSNVALASQ